MAKSVLSTSACIEIADKIKDCLYGSEAFRAETVLVLDAECFATIDMRSVPANGWIENKAAASGREIQWSARTREEVVSVPRRGSSPS